MFIQAIEESLLPWYGNMKRLRAYGFVISALLLGGISPLHAQSYESLIGKGDSLLDLGKSLKAVSYYDRAIKAGAKAEGYSARARAWYELDRMDRFILDVETALDYDKNHPYAQFQRALYAMRSRDWSLAKTSCDRALKAGIVEQMVPQVRICRGEAMAKLGQIEAAIDDLRAGIDAGEMDVEAMRLLASLYHDIELHESAAQVLERLVALPEGDNGDRINLGYELALLGRHRDAINHYQIALQEDKNNPIAFSNYAYSLYKLGQNDKAMTYVNRSLRSQPGNPNALRTRGILRLGKGEVEKGCKDLYAAKIGGGEFKEIDQLIEQHCLGIKPR